MDVQSEIANLTIIYLLKAHVMELDQRDQWEKYLPMVEHAYNKTIHTFTGKTPFEMVKLSLMVEYLSNVFATDEYSKDLTESSIEAKACD